jgi:hypothetical protein
MKEQKFQVIFNIGREGLDDCKAQDLLQAKLPHFGTATSMF